MCVCVCECSLILRAQQSTKTRMRWPKRVVAADRRIRITIARCTYLLSNDSTRTTTSFTNCPTLLLIKMNNSRLFFVLISRGTFYYRPIILNLFILTHHSFCFLFFDWLILLGYFHIRFNYLYTNKKTSLTTTKKLVIIINWTTRKPTTKLIIISLLSWFRRFVIYKYLKKLKKNSY